MCDVVKGLSPGCLDVRAYVWKNIPQRPFFNPSYIRIPSQHWSG